MRTLRLELARIWACVTNQSRWQLVLAFVVSAWTLSWVVGQAVAPPMAPSDVPRALSQWAGIPVGWLNDVSSWAHDPARRLVFGLFAVAGGLLWAASTERAQLPAVSGWLALLVAAEGIGYHPAVFRALVAMLGFVVLLTLLALPGRANAMVNRVVLIPRDVLRAGTTAAAMAAMVPLLAPGLVIVRLVRPYVTSPPRVVVPRVREEQKALVPD